MRACVTVFAYGVDWKQWIALLTEQLPLMS